MNISKCYIVIVTYNSSKYIEKCINSLLLLNNQNYKIIIIDNNSYDNTVQLISLKFEKYIDNKRISIIVNSKNLGYAYGINRAIDFSVKFDDCEYFWLLNSDVVVSSNCLDILFENSKTNNIISPGLYDYKNHKQIQSFGGVVNSVFMTTKNQTIKNHNIDFISGASLFFKKNIIEKIGLLPETYFMYYEDVDWCTKAKKNKIKLEIIDNCQVYHVNKKFIKLNLKLRSQFNRLIYSYKYFLHCLPIVLISVFVSITLTLIKRPFFNENHR